MGVALLAEGVDRNCPWCGKRQPETVALLAEGVDRNKDSSDLAAKSAKSPSLRRAWIEIGQCSHGPGAGWVALLAEGVDRNAQSYVGIVDNTESPSLRRAWIEINLQSGSELI